MTQPTESLELIENFIQNAETTAAFSPDAPLIVALRDLVERVRWHSIEKEGLPTEDGEYLWRDSESCYEVNSWIEKYDGIAHSWTERFTHYQKIEFTPEPGTEDQ